MDRANDLSAVRPRLRGGVVLRGLYGSGKTSMRLLVEQDALARGQTVISFSLEDDTLAVENFARSGRTADAFRTLIETKAKGVPLNESVTIVVDEFRNALWSEQSKEISEYLQDLARENGVELMLILHESQEVSDYASKHGFAEHRLKPLEANALQELFEDFGKQFGIVFEKAAVAEISRLTLTVEQAMTLARLVLVRFEDDVGAIHGDWLAAPWEERKELLVAKWEREGAVVTLDHVQDTASKTTLFKQPKNKRDWAVSGDWLSNITNILDAKTMVSLLTAGSITPENPSQKAHLDRLADYGWVSRIGDGYELRDSLPVRELRQAMSTKKWERMQARHARRPAQVEKEIVEALVQKRLPLPGLKELAHEVGVAESE